VNGTEATGAGLTIVGRLRSSRALARLVVLGGLAAALTVLGTFATIRAAEAPGLGIIIAKGHAVAVAERWAPVQPGDRVLSLQGVDPLDWSAWMRLRCRTPPGQQMVGTFARDGQAFTAAAISRTPGASWRLGVWVQYGTGVAMLLLGFITFVLRPDLAATRGLFTFCGCVGAGLLVDELGYACMIPRGVSVALCLYAFGAAAALRLFAIFPRPLPAVRRRPWLGWLFYAPAAAMVPAALVAAFDESGQVYEVLRSYTGVWLGVAGLGGIALSVAQLVAVRRDARLQIQATVRTMAAAVGIGLGGAAVLVFVRFAVGDQDTYFLTGNLLFLLVFATLTSYAVVRHNALSVDRFTAAVAGYALSAAVTAALFATAAIGLPWLVGASLRDSPVLLVGITAVCVAGLAPLHRRIQRMLDRRFFREHADATRMANALRDMVLTIQTRPEREGLAATLKLAPILRCSRAELWRLDDDGVVFRRDQWRGEAAPDPRGPVDRAGPLGQALAAGLVGGVDVLADQTLPPDAQAELLALDLAVAAPVVIHGVLLGFLAVDRKRSGQRYSAEEVSFLSIAAAQVGLALTRADDPGLRLDRYRVERRLGVGGMAEVYLAWQLGPGGFERKVALKRPLAEFAREPAAVELFLDEARAAAHLQHPHIARIYEVGETAGAYFLAMEYVDGPSLRALVLRLAEAGRHMPLPIALAIARDVLDALDYVHRQCDPQGRPLRLVHRDVTSGNVLIHHDGRVKLVDFGIASAANQVHRTMTGSVKGTLPYMSPEQALGKGVDHRTDLYATGALVYEMLTGRRPFPRGPAASPWTPQEPRRRPPTPAPDDDDVSAEPDETDDATAATTTVARVVGPDAGPVCASALAPEVTPAIDEVLVRAMAFDPAERYQRASDLAAALPAATAPVVPASHEEVAAWLLRETAA
jgi:serine/threonine protein kinase/GAF domain-containing protein